MGLISEIIIHTVETTVDGAIKGAIVTGVTGVLGAAAVTIEVVDTAAKAVGESYKKVSTGAKVVTTPIKDAIGAAVEKQKQLKENKNIKNTFKGSKEGLKYLINCTNALDKKGTHIFELYNANMDVVCRVKSTKRMSSTDILIIDDDGDKLIELNRKGLKNKISYINPKLVQIDSDIKNKIKTFDNNGNLLTGTTTFKEDKNTLGYSYKREDYVGGQYLLDIIDKSKVIPLIIQEVYREAQIYK